MTYSPFVLRAAAVRVFLAVSLNYADYVAIKRDGRFASNLAPPQTSKKVIHLRNMPLPANLICWRSRRTGQHDFLSVVVGNAVD